MPAVLTARLDGAARERLAATLAAHQIVSHSVIPLWEDASSTLEAP
jgi:hypothetical protein